MSDNSPFSFVIFGATGDLTKRKLVPALYGLYSMNLLPSSFKIFAFARRPYTTDSFVDTLVPFITDTTKWDSFREHIEYVQGDFSDQSSFHTLKEHLGTYESSLHACPIRLYYMAISPDDLPSIVEKIGTEQLHLGCGEEGRWTRIIIEKPFGHDLESARHLNSELMKYFAEEQIYRIDHYLGKETVQNILSVRFANIILEPVWCRDYIEQIEINAFEKLGVEERGGYYDTAGALRDMVQSHLLQVMSLVLMDQPALYDAQEIRTKKNQILQALRPMTAERVAIDTVRGQYVTTEGSEMHSYRDESKVNPASQTETYAAVRAYVDLEQWKDVPIIIRTGKRLAERLTEITVTFRRSQGTVFSNLFCELRSNTLKIRLQPDEGVKMRMLIKKPGFKMQLSDVYLDYKYSDTFDNLPDAYERLLLDAIAGDQSLYTRTDEIESSWRYITNILQLWNSENVPLQEYAIGSAGPELPMS